MSSIEWKLPEEQWSWALWSSGNSHRLGKSTRIVIHLHRDSNRAFNQIPV